MSELPRRAAMLCAVGAVCAAAGCARYGGEAAPAPTTGSAPAESPAEGSAPAEGKALAKAADIPVGGGAVFSDQEIVVTQPVAGEFKGFSAVCTHQGCLVSEVEDRTINCTCHGSKFRIADGSVATGPANQPLPTRAVAVNGDQISLA